MISKSDVPEIAAGAVMALAETRNPMQCPTCGARLEISLVGEVNPVYVARCPAVTVPHPTWICTPTMYLAG